MSAIPRYFIQDLLNRVDIVDLIQAKVLIKKRGANYHGLCPFHQEKSPSFTVSQTKQFYHCFGCGKHGNAIGFLMEFDRLDFVEAVEELARGQGLEVPREQGSASEKREDFQILYTLMEKAGLFYEDQLKNHPERERVVQYLKKRGLTGLTAKSFGLGFAPAGWEALLSFLHPSPAEIKALKQIGLISENDKGKVFDKFRDRVMFPIRDKRSRVVGFGGRVMDQGEPKYLNSPETPLFHKGKMLYGLFEAKKAHQTFQQIVVVEGYMDVVMLAQHGIHYAVAALGTATTPDHLRLLKQECSEIIFCFDGDAAGRTAAWRALHVTLPFMTGELDIRFLFLPEGEDPDSLVQREGKAAFEKRLRTQALSLADFVMTKLNAGVNLSSPEGKSRWLLSFKPLAHALPVGSYKTFLFDRLAQHLHMTFDQFVKELEKDEGHLKNQIERQESSKMSSLEEKAFRLLLQYPALAAAETEDFPAALREFCHILHEQKLQNAGQIVEYFRGKPLENFLAKLAEYVYPDNFQVEAEWQDILKRLAENRIKERAEQQLLEQLRQRQ